MRFRKGRRAALLLALAWRVRVMRTSNCYMFAGENRSPRPTVSSKSNLSPGTGTQVFNSDLFAALNRLKEGIRGSGFTDRPCKTASLAG